MTATLGRYKYHDKEFWKIFVACQARPVKGDDSFIGGRSGPASIWRNAIPGEEDKKTGRLFAETLPVVITHHP